MRHRQINGPVSKDEGFDILIVAGILGKYENVVPQLGQRLSKGTYRANNPADNGVIRICKLGDVH